MKQVLVTAPTGTIGSFVIRALREHDAAVRAYARDPSKAQALGPDVEIVVGDFADRVALRRAMTGTDAVFLSCANQPHQVGLENTVIDVAAEAGVGRLVKVSAQGASIGSPLAFWDAHARIEEHLISTGIPSTILRPGFLMTNLFASAESIRRTGQLFLPAGDAKVGFTDPRDVAAAAVTCLIADEDVAGTHGVNETRTVGGSYGATGTYRITGPEAMTFYDVAGQLSDALGRPVGYVAVPDPAARQAMRDAGMPDWIADNLITLFGLIRQGELGAVSDDLRLLTGASPRGFAGFATDHAKAFLG